MLGSRSVIVFNGQLFGVEELRRDLVARGNRFRAGGRLQGHRGTDAVFVWSPADVGARLAGREVEHKADRRAWERCCTSDKIALSDPPDRTSHPP